MTKLYNCNTIPVRLHRRIRIILYFHENESYFSNASEKLDHDRATIILWFHRGKSINNHWKDAVKNILFETGYAGVGLRTARLLETLLIDKPRSGTPAIYTVKQYTDIIKLARENPKDFGYPITHWSIRELTNEIHKQKISETISQRQVGRFLNEADLKPHKSKYWLNPKIDNKAEHDAQVKEICDVYINALKLAAEGIRIISVDEKTGMQALERAAPTKSMIPGKCELVEADYIRHDTLCLIPSFDIVSGKSFCETKHIEFVSFILRNIVHG